MVGEGGIVVDGRGGNAEPAVQLTIASLDALKVMSDPRRMRIVDALRHAPATVKELAGALDVAPKSLYYHVNLLEKHGLIRVVDTRLVSGITEKRYRATAYLFDFHDAATVDGRPHECGHLAAVDSILDITRAEIHRAARDVMIDPARDEPSERALFTEWLLLRLPPARVAELSARLRALAAEYATDETAVAQENTRTYRLLLALFPTYPRGPETGGSGKVE